MSKTEPFSHREGEDAVWNGLVIRSVETYGKNKRKKWNGYLAAGLFMTGLAVFWGF